LKQNINNKTSITPFHGHTKVIPILFNQNDFSVEYHITGTRVFPASLTSTMTNGGIRSLTTLVGLDCSISAFFPFSC